tara:strand:- start:2033 stop:3751 length:1719 start_codon:yes stop_codon:yes gene_type:complete
MMDNKFSIGYYKSHPIDIVSLENNYIPSTDDVQIGYNPFCIDKLQKYNPIYDKLFTLSNKNYNMIQLNHYRHFVNPHLVIDMSDIEHETDIFFKYSPLLDPLRYMVGKYENDSELLNNLPVATCVSNDSSHNVISKISSQHNCAYVDTFFYYLSSMTLQNHNIINCLDFYGSFLGIQQKYKYDVSDDIDYLTESPFFNNNNNHLFTLQNVDIDQYPNDDSRKQRPKLYISKTNHNISAVSIAESLTDIDDIDNINDSTLDNCIVYENKLNVDNSKVEDSVDDGQSSDDNSSIAYTTDSDEDDESDWETTTDTSNDDSTCSIQEDQYVYINNYPVQMICLEKCDGTFDDLFTSGSATLENTSSALFQVVMSLIIYQKMFSFTHNDLHTNNIMYIETDIPYLFYKFENIVYKVPTYGRIYKIIDFGRSIYRFNGTTYCSDSFGPGGDADTQYNCEPFFNNKKARLEPNMSFDLCRLGCSIYDFIIPEHLEYDDYDDLQKTIYRWCLDDNNKNVLYKKNGDERYPDFKLYKMIARTVHKHTPQEQLQYPFFHQFIINEKEVGEHVMDVNRLPKYF